LALDQIPYRFPVERSQLTLSLSDQHSVALDKRHLTWHRPKHELSIPFDQVELGRPVEAEMVAHRLRNDDAARPVNGDSHGITFTTASATDSVEPLTGGC